MKATIVRPRVYIGDMIALGPGKIDLLRHIDKTRSISAAARALRMPYKRAWSLLDSLNAGFGAPVVTAARGGKGGGGAALTPLGRALLNHYTALDRRVSAAAAAELKALRRLAVGK